ncbi:TlpA family protein disulfide reductase [bacterium]|nr:TlpA family protein disulfide reductase [bacterium]
MRTYLTKRVIPFVFFILLILSFGCEQKKEVLLTEAHIKSFLTDRYFEIPEGETGIPDFEYLLMTGEKEQFSDNKGKIVLLNFWATWCFPCKTEMPELEELKHAMKNENFRLIAINIGDKKERIRRFLENNPYSFDIVLDENKKISESFNILGLPTTYILTGDLKVIGKVMGPIDWKEKSFIQFLKNLIQHRTS